MRAGARRARVGGPLAYGRRHLLPVLAWLSCSNSLLPKTAPLPAARRLQIANLYDVFVNIAADEGEHVTTMQACQVRLAWRVAVLRRVGQPGWVVDWGVTPKDRRQRMPRRLRQHACRACTCALRTLGHTPLACHRPPWSARVQDYTIAQDLDTIRQRQVEEAIMAAAAKAADKASAGSARGIGKAR